ncbi:MAG TPA: ureidoglycolate lyase [Ramlibacter sp.]
MLPTLRLHTLDPHAFAAYGEVLDLADGPARAINEGTTQRHDLPSTLELTRHGGSPALATFRARAQALEGPWKVLERHLWGSQTFIPLQAGRWVVLVARGHAHPDPGSLAAFAVGPRQGVTLHAGTWHHPLIALDAGLFLVIERKGPAMDCEVVQLEVPVRLSP